MQPPIQNVRSLFPCLRKQRLPNRRVVLFLTKGKILQQTIDIQARAADQHRQPAPRVYAGNHLMRHRHIIRNGAPLLRFQNLNEMMRYTAPLLYRGHSRSDRHAFIDLH